MADLELIPLEPAPALRPYVLRCVGYSERPEVPVSELELPFAGAVVMLVLGEDLEIDGARIGSFATGVYDRPAVTRRSGAQSGLQLNLTPLGSRRLLGLPMDELTNRTVALEDVFGAGDLVDRVRELDDWPSRWALVEAAVLRRLQDAAVAPPQVEQAYGRIIASHGRVRVESLAAEVGWSRRHLAGTFRREVGVSPKTLGRIARFVRARTLLDRGEPLADVAYACGYADQPHFNREVRDLAWATPTNIARHGTAPTT